MRNRASAVLLALLAALVAAAPRPVAAADNPPAQIGKVDMDEVWRRYDLFHTLEVEFTNFRDTLEQQYTERQKAYPYLLREEYSRLMDLVKKGDKRSDPESNELRRLVALSDDIDRQWAQLQNVADSALTEVQRNRRKEIQDRQTQAANDIAEMEKDFKSQIEKRNAEISGQLGKNIEAAAADLAKDKGLVAVLRADAVLYGGIDVTADLVLKLNAQKQGPTPPVKPGSTPPAKPVPGK
jgi:Skp family chaperone for outer membrane proteins